MYSSVITVRTGSRPTVRDITGEAAKFVAGRGDGLLHVFVPHATAGVAIIETGAGSDDDLLRALDEVLPADDRWRHRHGSPGHGRDTCCRRSSPRTRRFRSSAARSHWVPGSRSASWIPMSTTRHA